jgi:hypothetical protein
MSSKVSGLLAEATSPVLQENLVGPALAREFPAAFPLMTAINEAHILMLAERGIVDRPTAAAMARAVIRVADEGAASVPLDAAREDPYFNYEARITELAGPEVGGRTHIARSRNDLKAAQDRLRARTAALRILDGWSGRPCWRGRHCMPASSCRATPTCSRPSPSPSAGTCWASRTPWSATTAASPSASRGSTSTRSARARSPAPRSRSTGR